MGNYLSSSSKKSSKKPKTSTITDIDKTILSLKTQRNKLNDQQKLLDARIDRHQEVARQLLREGRRDRALLALKKKKLTEKQQQDLAAHILNLEGMLNNIEGSKQQARLVEVLQQGNDALKQLQQQVSIDDVRKLMEDTAEARAYQDELNEALSHNLSDMDSEAVAAELEALEDEQLQQEMQGMPKVPETKPAQAIKAQQVAAASKAEAEEEEEEVAATSRQEAPMLAS